MKGFSLSNKPKRSFSSSSTTFGGQKNSAPAVAASKAEITKDYFDDDDDEPAPSFIANANANVVSDDFDPLDDFMNSIHQQVEKEKETVGKTPQALPQIVSYSDEYDDYEDDDRDTEAFAKKYHSDDENDNDDDDKKDNNDSNKKNPKGKMIEPLPKIDHTTIQYPKIIKNTYEESNDTKAMTEETLLSLRQELQISITCNSTHQMIPVTAYPKPVSHIDQLQRTLDDKLYREIVRLGYAQLTPIQSQAIPILLSGYNLLGLAKTGSGKTFAYLWPMIEHLLSQKHIHHREGPCALILVPTRELATQVYNELKRFTKVYEASHADCLSSVVIYGGPGKYEMMKALKTCPAIVIATPGRYIEMVKSKCTILTYISYVVLDEADRMLALGFEYQIRSILQNLNPYDKQIVLFSATMKRKMELFIQDIFTSLPNKTITNTPNNTLNTTNTMPKTEYFKLIIGSLNESNEHIHQLFHVFPQSEAKLTWLLAELDGFASEGKVLIFVLHKQTTEELKLLLQQQLQHQRHLDITLDCLHGDKDQSERHRIITAFKRHHQTNTNTTNTSTNNTGMKKEELRVLIATDIAARGLDISDIRTVINYDCPKSIDTYVHRIGRTGRMGIQGITPGTAHTLLTSPNDSSFAIELLFHQYKHHNNSNSSGNGNANDVPESVYQLASVDAKWNKVSRQLGSNGGHGHSSGGGKGMGGNNSNSKGGLGSNQGMRAMTSEMMANQTYHPNNNSSGGFALPKHLEKVVYGSNNKQEVEEDEEEGDSKKRKSRFAANATPPQPAQQQQQPLYQSAAPVLRGFVRSSNNYSSVQQSSSAAASSPVPTPAAPAVKKSRWDR